MSSASKRRRQVSRRASSEARKSEKSIGAMRVQMPPGLRKSGMPDSVLMPAPVKKTMRRARAISSLSAATATAASVPGERTELAVCHGQHREIADRRRRDILEQRLDRGDLAGMRGDPSVERAGAAAI